MKNEVVFTFFSTMYSSTTSTTSDEQAGAGIPPRTLSEDVSISVAVEASIINAF